MPKQWKISDDFYARTCYGLDNYHLGAIMAHQMLLFTALAAAVMNIMLTIRHTRRDEELGRVGDPLPAGGPAVQCGRCHGGGSDYQPDFRPRVAVGLAVLGLEYGLERILTYGAVLTKPASLPQHPSFLPS